MAEIRFYHLTRTGIEQALPGIVHKALSAGHRIVVQTRDDAETERISTALWSARPDWFLPHGMKGDARPAMHPVWIAPDGENPNAATVLIMLAGALPAEGRLPEWAGLCCDLFDGRDESALNAARARWKNLKESGQDHSLTYWQQGEKGWEQKA